MNRSGVFIAVLSGCFSTVLMSCDNQTEQAPIRIQIAAAPSEPESDIEIPSNLSDKDRMAIVVERVNQDIHEIASTYPDLDMRLLLEIIAGDSGTHPKKIPLDKGLRSPPVGFDEIDVIELIMTIEDAFGFRVGNEEFERDFQNPTVNQLITLIRDRKTTIRVKDTEDNPSKE